MLSGGVAGLPVERILHPGLAARAGAGLLRPGGGDGARGGAAPAGGPLSAPPAQGDLS